MGLDFLYSSWLFVGLFPFGNKFLIIQKKKKNIFYHSMNYASKCIIDEAYCGAFKRRSAEEARQPIEDFAKCNYKVPSKA